MGYSSLILALWLIECLTVENTAAVVVSHEKGATQRLFQRVKFYIDHFKIKPLIKTDNRNEISFPKTNSTFFIGTAGSKTSSFGHGETLTRLHLSEASRYQNPDIITGLLESVPASGWVIIETTSNGFGDLFHQFWERSQNDKSVWAPHFYGWPELESNRRTPETGFKMTEEEKKLSVRFSLDIKQVAWRRWKIGSMERPDLFPQQHPINDIEAFIKSGTNIFEPIILQQWYEKNYSYQQGELEKIEDTIRFNINDGGNLKIYDENRQSEYAVGVDVMEGIEIEGLSEKEVERESKKHDWNTVVISDRQTWKQVAVYRSQEAPELFARKVDLIGRYFNNAIVCVESNVGATILYILINECSYSNLYYGEVVDENTSRVTKKVGFRTTTKSKRILIDLQESVIRKIDTEIKDRQVIREHLAFSRDPNGKMSAPVGMTDDLVIASSLATYICERNPYNPREEYPQFKKKRRHSPT